MNDALLTISMVVTFIGGTYIVGTYLYGVFEFRDWLWPFH